MAVRKIIQIDEEKCTGCGLCAEACHEGAIGMADTPVGPKARLMRDDYCDGFGDCLPACPADAIAFIEREAAAYDEAAVIAAKMAKAKLEAIQDVEFPAGFTCPGTAVQQFDTGANGGVDGAADADGAAPSASSVPSQISTWPIQIKLLPENAPYFDGCDLLVAADCTAFAYGNFHHDFMRGKVCVIGCPKLDAVDYADKLAGILAKNDVRSICVTRMTVPCCGGLQNAVARAVAASGKNIPVEVTTISLQGDIVG